MIRRWVASGSSAVVTLAASVLVTAGAHAATIFTMTSKTATPPLDHVGGPGRS